MVCCDASENKHQRRIREVELRGIPSQKLSASASSYQNRVLNFKTAQLPPSPLGREASLSSEKKQVTFPGQQPLVDRGSSGSFGSTASTRVSSLPSAQLSQAELDFSRGSSAHNTPRSSATNTPRPSAPSTPCPHDEPAAFSPFAPRPDDAPAPASAFAGVELARTLGLKLRRDSFENALSAASPRVLEVQKVWQP